MCRAAWINYPGRGLIKRASVREAPQNKILTRRMDNMAKRKINILDSKFASVAKQLKLLLKKLHNFFYI